MGQGRREGREGRGPAAAEREDHWCSTSTEKGNTKYGHDCRDREKTGISKEMPGEVAAKNSISR